MESDASHHVKKCQTCQKHENLIHALVVDLHSIKTPWLFHTWAFNLIRPISTPSKGYKWILAATELSTKWVEVIPLKNAAGLTVANFIKENIICRFGVPNTILSYNGTPFINKYVKSLLETYQVKHHKSTPYYPKGNGQAEATNKTLIRILSKMMDEFGGTWSEQLIVALWVYRTSKRKLT
ncbi:protein NYNRIN-like [Camellia sinensis]|uniref:protein NYNRIN-like n=1 Tax=Camellia sinensis TaxID=4442 RepID=UPI001036B044|nr:protein NYNRIN-like [Camellia sinensis]